ncbi:hypothetical protein [Desertibacillus haloalkaliphilus]|uniref:hypothetical protein n=1 Tax=Desertibacillus haloalkaliphilus TaxID=1328930 RepID=UPI001C2639A4|nr:hypothetical protein [Desertibacillus haloalkaliphilus]MBU8906218.1 hypothetical protein [Desertibacillus haloalkaliphilus]
MKTHANFEEEIMKQFIEWIRLNKHVKLYKANPTLAYSVREFVKKYNIPPLNLMKILEHKMVVKFLKAQLPIEVIDNPQVTDFHWIDNPAGY